MKKPNLPGVKKYGSIKEAFREISKECQGHHEKVVAQLKARPQQPKKD